MRRLATLTVSLLLATSAFASTDTIRKGFNVAPGGTLRLSAATGRIKVVSGGTGVAIEVVRKADGGDAEERMRKHKISFHQNGNDVVIDDELEARRGLFFNWSDYEVQWNIRVPSNYNLDVRTSGGSIELADIGGTVQARTSGGSIRTGRLSGASSLRTSGGAIAVASANAPLEVRTSGGSIRIGDTAASVDAKTSGGSIHLGRIGGDLAANTSGGGIEIEGATGRIEATTSGGSIHAKITGPLAHDSRLSTSGGSVNVAIAKGVGAEIDAKSSGRVESEVAVTINGSISRNSLRGRIGNGGPTLVLRSSGGGIRIRNIQG